MRHQDRRSAANTEFAFTGCAALRASDAQQRTDRVGSASGSLRPGFDVDLADLFGVRAAHR